jgi:phage gpG-like protein
MPLTVNVRITGDKEFLAKLKKLGPALNDFKRALTEVGDHLTSYYSNQAFASQGGVYGTPWARLAPSTQVFKAKHYRQYAAIPLIATGEMKKSFTSSPSEKSLTIANSAPYFKYHQSTEPRTKLPRRQMLGINSDVKKVIKQVIEADIHRKVATL